MPPLDRQRLVLVALTATAWVAWGLYAIMPIDLVPDVFPLIGWLDDLLGLSSVIGLTAATARQLLDTVPAPDPHPVYEPIPEAELRRL